MNTQVLDAVIQAFSEMPGIGKKTAQRLAYYVLHREDAYAEQMAQALADLKKNLRWCQSCYNISESDLCEICTKQDRDHELLCVVEDAANVANIERSGSYRGYYHVLQGALSPVNGIGPEDLRMKELFERLQTKDISEVILATNPTVEGEATAMYLLGVLESTAIRVSRIGMGIPIGGNLDYCDEITMAKAIENRRILT